MAFICEETSLSKFWMLEGALLFNWTVLHPPTQVGHVVSLDLDAFDVKTVFCK